VREIIRQRCRGVREISPPGEGPGVREIIRQRCRGVREISPPGEGPGVREIFPPARCRG